MNPGSATSPQGIPRASAVSYDIFLSHNSSDKAAVRQLGAALIQRGIKVWLDEWELVPGRPWQEALEEIIETARSVAVLVGQDGVGPWQSVEMRACINEFVRRGVPVIPVLLADARAEPELPIFLRGLTWVDLRKEGLTEENLDKLIWGVTGNKPAYSLDVASEMAVRSLDDLRSLTKSGHVRDLVVHFRGTFRAICDQVARLGDYKDLHDHLHEIEICCQNLLAPRARLSDVDRIDWDLLGDAETTLQHVVGLLRDVQRRCCLSTQETAWIDVLRSGQAQLQKANEERNPKLLQAAAWQIGRTLRLEIPQINTKLTQVARDLRLSMLVMVMTEVADALLTPSHTEVPISHLQQGIDALQRLSQTLMSLVAQHDEWQRIDQELRLIEVSIERDTQELKMAWPDLILRVEALYDTVTTEWVVSVRKDAKKLDQVVGGENHSEVQAPFRRFHRQVSNRFFRVDRELKHLCENLRQIDGPLGSLLEEIK